MSLPLHDWQFWAVTAVFLGAVGWVVVGLVRWRRRGRSRRAALTMGGRPVSRRDG